MAHVLTDKFCRDLPHPEHGQKFYFDSHKDSPPGFALRVTAGAKSWLLTYYADGRQRRVTLPVGFPAWGPAKARQEAAKLRMQVLAGGDPLAERQERASAVKARSLKDAHTLGALLMAYCDHLESSGKASARAVRGSIAKHVEQAHPRLWKKPAIEVEPEDGVTILADLVKAGSKREAGKVRSYLRAAYAAAVRARLDASASAELRAFGLRTNPLGDLPTFEGGSGGTRERALSVEELRAYWRRIEFEPGADGALLRFHLLTGAQRAEQLARAVSTDYDADAGVLILRDIKGRRTEARVHSVPLIEPAIDALDAMHGTNGPHVVTTNRGKTGAAYFAIQHRVRKIAEAMLAAGESMALFTPGDLRRTVETRLAGLGVTREVRAQLQSHGLGGVQSKHYDRHSYIDEKRAALDLLHQLVTAAPATVTPIKRATSRKASGASR